MCGIAGYAGQFSSDLLEAMSRKIVHRGPDDSGFIRLPSQRSEVGLIHRRLSIIDLSSDGKQPMTVRCACCQVGSETLAQHRLWLIYNGELYNYRELREQLIQKGHAFCTQTDSEVLLHLYAEEGPCFLKKLNGMFAFALYDGRVSGQNQGMHPGDILLARDGVGIKPLYYSQIQNGFLFASELKALLACSDISRELDFKALHYYLAYLWCPAPLTPLTQIKKLLPGEAMIVRHNQINKKWIFYDLPYHQEKTQQTESDMRDELVVRLETAVQRQLMADVPVGAFLSGGLDSSSIVAMMRKLQPDRAIRCYSIGFSDARFLEGNPSDLPYAQQVANHLGVDLHVLDLQPDMIQHLSRMIYHLDEPQADPAPINALLIAEQARADGIKVLLSGAGGDDIFSGYRRHYALKMESVWSWWPLKARQYTKQLSRSLNTKHAFLRRIQKACSHMDLSKEHRLASYFLWSPDSVRFGLYSNEMRSILSKTDTLAPLLQSLDNVPPHLEALDKMLYLEGKHFLADHNLNYTDKSSMAAGIEVRVPLLDPDLIEFAARIPPRFKQNGRVGKSIFKKAMQPYLPKDVIYRKKTGFGAPLRYWLRHELKPLVSEALSSESLTKRNLFDPLAVKQLIHLNDVGKIDGSYTLFSLLCIELWCRIFIDNSIVMP